MKWIAFVLIAVATSAAVFVLTVPASGQGGGEAVPIFGIKIPTWIPRLETGLRGPRRRRPAQFRCHFGQ